MIKPPISISASRVRSAATLNKNSPATEKKSRFSELLSAQAAPAATKTPAPTAIPRETRLKELVAHTLQNPQHPFARLPAALQREMIDAVSKQLLASHYLRS